MTTKVTAGSHAHRFACSAESQFRDVRTIFLPFNGCREVNFVSAWLDSGAQVSGVDVAVEVSVRCD